MGDAMKRVAPVIQSSGNDCVQMMITLSKARVTTGVAMDVLTLGLGRLSSNRDKDGTRLFEYK